MTITNFTTDDRYEITITDDQDRYIQDAPLIGWTTADDTTSVEPVALISGAACTQSEYRENYATGHTWTVSER